jgi:glycosyltransferase involved in cell wall biosynthesis
MRALFFPATINHLLLNTDYHSSIRGGSYMPIENPKVSIITVVKNGAETIEETIRSVLGQTYPHIEYLVIDGGSTDRTIEIVKRYEGRISYWASEQDEGLYDGMNKGIRNATGEVVGILGSDDVYLDAQVIEDVVAGMSEHSAESCYADLFYVDRKNSSRLVRYWKSGPFSKGRFKRGWMPPHPTFFVRREVYLKYGFFNTGFSLAADYELMLRFLYRYGISTIYIPRILVNMKTGGKSHPGPLNTLKAMAENYQAWRVNGLRPNPLTFALKPLSKVGQYFYRNGEGLCFPKDRIDIISAKPTRAKSSSAGLS